MKESDLRAEERILIGLFRKQTTSKLDREKYYSELEKFVTASRAGHSLTDADRQLDTRVGELRRYVVAVEAWLSPANVTIHEESGSHYNSIAVAKGVLDQRLSLTSRGVLVGLLLLSACISALAFAAWWTIIRSEAMSSVQPLYRMQTKNIPIPATGNIVEVLPEGIRISSTLEKPESGGTTGGAYITLGPDLESSFSGKKITILVTAKRYEDSTSKEINIAYSTAGVGNSGWLIFELEDDFRTYSFTYMVPRSMTEPGYDYLGIWASPGEGGKGGDILVKDVEIRLADDPAGVS